MPHYSALDFAFDSTAETIERRAPLTGETLTTVRLPKTASLALQFLSMELTAAQFRNDERARVAAEHALGHAFETYSEFYSAGFDSEMTTALVNGLMSDGDDKTIPGASKLFDRSGVEHPTTALASGLATASALRKGEPSRDTSFGLKPAPTAPAKRDSDSKEVGG